LLTEPAKLAVTFVFRTGLAALWGAARCEGYCPDSIPIGSVRVKLSRSVLGISPLFLVCSIY
jgi:hypothetical protein